MRDESIVHVPHLVIHAGRIMCTYRTTFSPPARIVGPGFAAVFSYVNPTCISQMCNLCEANELYMLPTLRFTRDESWAHGPHPPFVWYESPTQAFQESLHRIQVTCTFLPPVSCARYMNWRCSPPSDLCETHHGHVLPHSSVSCGMDHE